MLDFAEKNSDRSVNESRESDIKTLTRDQKIDEIIATLQWLTEHETSELLEFLEHPEGGATK